jgi:hypothetical protein
MDAGGNADGGPFGSKGSGFDSSSALPHWQTEQLGKTRPSPAFVASHAAPLNPPSQPSNSSFPRFPANSLTNPYRRAILSRVSQPTSLPALLREPPCPSFPLPAPTFQGSGKPRDHTRNPVRSNTYEPPRKCCIQRTYGKPNSFRCNTYKNTGGGGSLSRTIPSQTNQLEHSYGLVKARLSRRHGSRPGPSIRSAPIPFWSAFLLQILSFRTRVCPHIGAVLGSRSFANQFQEGPDVLSGGEARRR